MAFKVGQILEHGALTDLGRARVEQVIGSRIHLLFESTGGGERKIFELSNGLLSLSANQSPQGFPRPISAISPSGKKIRSTKRAPKKSPNAWPFEEAWKRFIGKYPAGFQDPKYVSDERDYKLAAVSRWNEQFGPEGIARLKASGDPGEVGKAFANVYQGLNLLHTIEWLKFLAVVKVSPESIKLVEEYAALVAEGRLSEERFNRLLQRFDAVDAGQLKWTLLTLWPYLASFKSFPFIKPEVTKAAAGGMNISINYNPKPNYLTYQGVVSLYDRLWELLEPQGARDWVDIQSFVWVGWR